MGDPSARPERGPSGYAFPAPGDDLIPWSEVAERLAASRHFWLATTNADGTPRVRPVWGVWVDDRFYFDGHPASGWARNIARDPRVVVHLESAEHVVIVEGTAEDVERTDADLGARITSAWQDKYGRLVPDAAANGIFRLTPARARAWSENLTDATVWELS